MVLVGKEGRNRMYTKKYVPCLLISPTIVVLLSVGIFPVEYSIAHIRFD